MTIETVEEKIARLKAEDRKPRAIQLVVYDMANNPLSNKLVKDLERAVEEVVRRQGPTVASTLVIDSASE